MAEPTYITLPQLLLILGLIAWVVQHITMLAIGGIKEVVKQYSFANNKYIAVLYWVNNIIIATYFIDQLLMWLNR